MTPISCGVPSVPVIHSPPSSHRGHLASVLRGRGHGGGEADRGSGGGEADGRGQGQDGEVCRLGEAVLVSVVWVVENLRHRDGLNLRLLMVRGVVLSNHSSPLGGRGANSAVGSSKYVKGGYDRTPAIEWTIQVDHPWILVDLAVTTPLTILVCCLWATPQLHVELVEVVLVEGCEVVETSSKADTTHLDKNNKYTF